MHEFVRLIASDARPGDQLGWAVAVDGDTILAGANCADPNGVSQAGAAYVFVRANGVWSQQARLVAPAPFSGDHFGCAVALDGDTAVVGAYCKWVQGATGAAYVFVRSGGVWTLQGQLTASDGDPFDRFGDAVAVAGDTVLVGAPDHDGGGVYQAGAAYVFARTDGMWAETAELVSWAPPPHAYDEFGCSVALDADTALIGAAYAVGSPPLGGAATSFVRSGGAWYRGDILCPSDPKDDSSYGRSVALDGDTAVIGALQDIDPPCGVAYVHHLSGLAWPPVTRLRARDATAGDGFSKSVALDGDRLLIGAYRSQTGTSGDQTGAAYLFVRSNDIWRDAGKLTASDAAHFDALGYAVALDDVIAVVGAPYDDRTDLPNAGSIYVFNVRTPLIGDMNCDGVVDLHDIDPFVTRLTRSEEYWAWFPTCQDLNGDIDSSGSVGFGDINPFIDLLMQLP